MKKLNETYKNVYIHDVMDTDIRKKFHKNKLEQLKNKNIMVKEKFYKGWVSKAKIYFIKRLLNLSEPNERKDKRIAIFQSEIDDEERKLRSKTGLDIEAYQNHMNYFPINKLWQYLEKDWECGVCRENKRDLKSSDPTHMIAVLKCEHKFCSKCISGWFVDNTLCSLCRKNINSKE
jgi:hypothetical protein